MAKLGRRLYSLCHSLNTCRFLNNEQPVLLNNASSIRLAHVLAIPLTEMSPNQLGRYHECIDECEVYP